MGKIICSLVVVMAVGVNAGGPFPVTDKILLQRHELLTRLKAHVQEEVEPSAPNSGGRKSVPKAVVLSAVVPGAGQFYAGSYIKSLLFLTVEIAAWVVNIRYNKRGDKKDAEFRAFADRYWSEYRYWSYLYFRLQQSGVDLPKQFETYTVQGKDWILIRQDQYPEAKQVLRDYENVLRGFTHRLPEKAEDEQQYYEMIGKYPGQFGNAWEDASFFVTYSGYEGRVTPLNERYVQMRDESNRYFDIAGYGAMVALVNHVISAIDAGFTTRNFNRKHKVRLSYKNIYYPGEYVNLVGVQMDF